MKTVYFTKYAITSGIQILSIDNDEFDDLFGIGSFLYKGMRITCKEAFRTKDEAVERFKQMKESKLLSLQKQVVKLENKEVSFNN